MKALDTAVRVLKLFTDLTEPLSVTEIAERTGLNKSHVSKILGTYRRHGLLVQEPVTRRYSVGPGVFELGVQYVNSQPLAREALPIMRELVDSCGHSATLSVLHDDHVLHLVAIEGPLYIDGHSRVGSRLPVHATASGKVLLAWLPEERIDDLLARVPLKPVSGLTIKGQVAFKSELRAVRALGSAVSRGESALGVATLAAPIIISSEVVLAAVGFVIPDQLFDDEAAPTLMASLHHAARRISLKLGAFSYPYGGKKVIGCSLGEGRLVPS